MGKSDITKRCSSDILFSDGRDANIELLEECSEDLRYERERFWMLQFPNRVNHAMCGVPRKEQNNARGRKRVTCPTCHKEMCFGHLPRHIRRMHTAEK